MTAQVSDCSKRGAWLTPRDQAGGEGTGAELWGPRVTYERPALQRVDWESVGNTRVSEPGFLTRTVGPGRLPTHQSSLTRGAECLQASFFF